MYSPKLMVKATLMFGDDFKIQNSKQRERKIWLLFEDLDHLNFGFVPNFDIRISDLPIANSRLCRTVSNNTQQNLRNGALSSL